MMLLVEVGKGLVPDIIPPIIQVIMVDHLNDLRDNIWYETFTHFYQQHHHFLQHLTRNSG